PGTGHQIVLATLPIDQFFPFTETVYDVGASRGAAVDDLDVDSTGSAYVLWYFTAPMEGSGDVLWRVAPGGRVVFARGVGAARGGLAISENGSLWTGSSVYSSYGAAWPTVRPIQPSLRGASDAFVTRIDLPATQGPAPRIDGLSRKPGAYPGVFKTVIA